MTRHMTSLEQYLQLMAAHIGLDANSQSAQLPESGRCLDLHQQQHMHAALQSNAPSASIMQQLSGMRAELTRLQQAQLSSMQAEPFSAGANELTGLRQCVNEQSSQVQQLHQSVSKLEQDSTALQASAAAQEAATAWLQQSQKDVASLVGTASSNSARHAEDMQQALSQLNEQIVAGDAQRSEELSRLQADLGNLSSSSALHNEQLNQFSVTLAKHDQLLATRESTHTDGQAVSKTIHEKPSSVASNMSVAGAFPLDSIEHVFDAVFISMILV